MVTNDRIVVKHYSETNSKVGATCQVDLIAVGLSGDSGHTPVCLCVRYVYKYTYGR